jgi:hypothetical protein
MMVSVGWLAGGCGSLVALGLFLGGCRLVGMVLRSWLLGECVGQVLVGGLLLCVRWLSGRGCASALGA